MAADARADAIMDEIAVFAQERRDNETHTRGARRPKRARMTVFDEGGNELSSSSLDRQYERASDSASDLCDGDSASDSASDLCDGDAGGSESYDEPLAARFRGEPVDLAALGVSLPEAQIASVCWASLERGVDEMLARPPPASPAEREALASFAHQMLRWVSFAQFRPQAVFGTFAMPEETARRIANNLARLVAIAEQ